MASHQHLQQAAARERGERGEGEGEGEGDEREGAMVERWKVEEREHAGTHLVTDGVILPHETRDVREGSVRECEGGRV